MYKIYLKHFGVMNVNFNCRVIPTHYKYTRIMPLPPWRWPHDGRNMSLVATA